MSNTLNSMYAAGPSGTAARVVRNISISNEDDGAPIDISSDDDDDNDVEPPRAPNHCKSIQTEPTDKINSLRIAIPFGRICNGVIFLLASVNSVSET